MKNEINLTQLKPIRIFKKLPTKIKNDLVKFLLDCKKIFSVAAYGAAAKGNTLLNYAGVKKDLISYVCDRDHFKTK